MYPGLMKIGVWNVRGLYGKEKLLQEELKKANVDIAVIPETKKKIRVRKSWKFIFYCTVVSQQKKSSCRYSNND